MKVNGKKWIGNKGETSTEAKVRTPEGKSGGGNLEKGSVFLITRLTEVPPVFFSFFLYVRRNFLGLSLPPPSPFPPERASQDRFGDRFSTVVGCST